VQLGQLLMNLVLNGNDALSGQAGRVTIHVGYVAGEDLFRSGRPQTGQPAIERTIGTFQLHRNYACLSVEDSGAGIPPEILEKIFDPFFTTKKRARGTGLGLAVVHGVIGAHGAACRVITREGAGTVFAVYFPLIGAEDGRLMEAKKPAAPQAGPQRIALVDDEEDVLEAVKIGLARRGFDVQAFQDPFEALAAIEKDQDQFDVLITDQTMPQLEGGQLAKHVKALSPRMKIIICSGRDMEGEARPAVDAVLAKPVDLDELVGSIRSVTRAKG